MQAEGLKGFAGAALRCRVSPQDLSPYYWTRRGDLGGSQLGFADDRVPQYRALSHGIL